MSHDITHMDVLRWIAEYDGPLFHALLCDPPYHLTDIARTFQGNGGSIDPRTGQERSNTRRVSKGFMNATWDGGDIAFRPETWAALGTLLHPGAFGMAFAGTRGYHRMATAIEDAGFILHPVICWNFASGFPKATRLDVQIDRAAGAERAIVGTKPQTGAKFKLTQELIDNGGFNDPDRDDYDVTEPATPLAQAWQGHRYGGQVLKPAIELICVFQKPYAGRPVDSITRTGAGAINVDGGRIGTDRRVPHSNSNTPTSIGATGVKVGAARPDDQFDTNMGRWPANLLLSHVYLPVLRLSAIISLDTKEVIERYFDGYNRVHELRQGISGSKEQGQLWPGEILQPGMQERVSEDAHQGAKPPVWRSPHSGISTEDVRRSETALVNTVRPETSGMEGRHVPEQRVSPCFNQSDERGRSGVGVADGTEGQRVCAGTSDRDGEEDREAINEIGDSTPPKRRQVRQSPRELDDHGNGTTFHGASEDRAGIDQTARRKPTLEVLADDIPPGWFRYFEPTGIDLGCNGTCAPGCPVAALGAQSGESESAQTGMPRKDGPNGWALANGGDMPRMEHGDSGTAARFFFNADYAFDRLEANDPLIYVPKASTTEREAGLEHDRSVECIEFEFAGEENGSWVEAGQKVKLLVDTEVSPPKVIGAYMTQQLDASAWNTMLFGNESEGRSPLDGKSITVTRTNLITESTTLNYLIRSLTSVYTADANSEQTDGGSPVASAGQSSPSVSFILAQAVSLPGVINAASGTRWTISVVGKLNRFELKTINDGRQTPIDNPFQRGETTRRNIHATIKPISLNRHLATLLLPPDLYAPRRLLVPFAGAASEIIGAMLAGWEDVQGVELELQHVEIARARIAFWQQMKYKLMNPDAPVKVTMSRTPDGQMEMF